MFIPLKMTTNDSKCISARGLPYKCTKYDISDFFQGLGIEEIVFGKEAKPNGWVGDRPSGEAIIRFSSKEDASEAMKKDREFIGNRYVELTRIGETLYDHKKENYERIERGEYPLSGFRKRRLDDNSYARYNAYIPPWNTPPMPSMYQPYDYDYGYGYPPYFPPAHHHAPAVAHRYQPYAYGAYVRTPSARVGPGTHPCRVQLIGLPFNVSLEEVELFFAPLQTKDVRVGMYPNGRSTGDGYVDFGSLEEVKEAMKKHRSNIGHRYIELYRGDNVKLISNATYVSLKLGKSNPSPGNAVKPTPSIPPFVMRPEPESEPRHSTSSFPYYGYDYCPQPGPM